MDHFKDLTIHSKERFGVQTKLTVGQPNDHYEQEADRVAEQVARMPDPNSWVRQRGSLVQPVVFSLERENTSTEPSPSLRFSLFPPTVNSVSDPFLIQRNGAAYVMIRQLQAKQMYDDFVRNAERYGLPVRFLRRVGRDYSISFGSSSAVNPWFNTMTLEEEELRSGSQMAPALPIGEATAIQTIYHEATHAYLDLLSNDPRFSQFITAGEQHYQGARTTQGATTTDPERVFHEAAASYVGHRAATWWSTFESLSIYVSMARTNPAAAGRLRQMNSFERVREDYNRQMSQIVFGYSEEGGFLGVGSRQATTTRAMTGQMKTFLDHELLEDKIPDRFEAVAGFQQLLRQAENSSTSESGSTTSPAPEVQRQSTEERNTVSRDLQSQVIALRGGGHPLSDPERAFFEPRFGYDFAQVRIHTDHQAAETARTINARAFTLGTDVVFGTGQYEPSTMKGRRLLAHELTHVVQQKGPLSHISSKWLQRQVPQDITAQVGPVSGQGGLIRDSSRKRMSIIVGPNDTLRTIAQRLLPIWNNAQPFTPPGTSTPRPVTQLTEEQLAKGLLVYNRYHLAVPSMTEWKVGLRFPLPIEVNRVNGERTLNPDLIAMWANIFDSAWLHLLDVTPAATAAPTQAALEQSVQTFLQETQSLTARSIHLSARAMRNAREAEPFIQEVFRQATSNAFDLALAFMDQIVIHQFDLLASQTAGQGIINTIRNALADAPTRLSPSQQQSLNRANRLLNRLGVFSTETAERFRDIYITEVPGRHCMAAVYHGLEGLFSEGVSQSIQNQVTRESREVMRRTGRDTNHMDRIMETVRARGMAGPETRLVYQRVSNTWQPDPQATVLSMTHPSVAGWYFFGLSLHAAYHSVILAVDKTDPANPSIYWMDQFSRGFTNNVTGTLMNQMRRFRPGHGFAPSRLWQIIPAADTLITLD
jgi:hypothetical protein